MARLAAEQSEQRLPSVVAGLVRDGELIWTGGRGKVDGRTPDADVQYRCGSITKTFVGQTATQSALPSHRSRAITGA